MVKLREALVGAGFGGFVTLRSQEQKRRELQRLGLVRTLPKSLRQRQQTVSERRVSG